MYQENVSVSANGKAKWRGSFEMIKKMRQQSYRATLKHTAVLKSVLNVHYV